MLTDKNASVKKYQIRSIWMTSKNKWFHYLILITKPLSKTTEYMKYVHPKEQRLVSRIISSSKKKSPEQTFAEECNFEIQVFIPGD